MKARILILVLSLALMGHSGLVLAADAILIGLTGPFTGGSSPMGLSMRNGVHIAVAEINASGGVLGRPLELVERDDEANPKKAAELMEGLLKAKIVAGLGMVNTAVALVCIKHYQDARIPVIVNVSAGGRLTTQYKQPNYVFRIAAPDDIQADMVVADATEKRNISKVALLTDNTGYGKSGLLELKNALTKRKLTAVSEETFGIGDRDMTAQLLRAKQAGAGALLVWGIGPELAAIANTAVSLGWQVPIVGGWTLSMGNFINNADANGNGVRMPQTFIEEADTPKRKAFIESHQKQFRRIRMSSAVSAAQGYDSAYILAAAIRQAGSTDGSMIRLALENLQGTVHGIVADHTRPFTPTDHEAIESNMVLIGEVRDGIIVRATYDPRAKAGGQRK